MAAKRIARPKKYPNEPRAPLATTCPVVRRFRIKVRRLMAKAAAKRVNATRRRKYSATAATRSVPRIRKLSE
jgi:hypothetical protein